MGAKGVPRGHLCPETPANLPTPAGLATKQLGESPTQQRVFAPRSWELAVIANSPYAKSIRTHLPFENMTSSIRSREGVFPGVTTEPVPVRDVIVEGAVIGSFYHLEGDRWEFLGPWDDTHRMLVDSTEDRLVRGDRTFWLYTDGSSRGDPVGAAIGAVLYDSHGQEVDTLSRRIGPATNNEAEYRAFIGGLELALEHNVHCLVVRCDSKLVANQVRGTFKVRAAKLKPLHSRAVELLPCLLKHHIEFVPRKYNRAADRLADAAFSKGIYKEEVDKVAWWW